MSKIKIQSIIILLFFLIFSYFNIGEYLNYQKDNNLLINNEKIIREKISNFSLDKIRNLEKINLFTTPNKILLENILLKIDNAKKSIYIEVYMLTNKKIVSKIIQAKKRGLDVKIILERNPYKIPGLNNKTYKSLKKNSVNVVWSNPNNYSLNHSKMILIDNEIIISTGNLTYSTFTKNKDLFLVIKDNILIKKLKKIFLFDYNGKKIGIYENNLLLSPNYSRNKIKILLSSAKKEIKMYFPYLEDNEFKKLIIKQAKSGIKIKIIVGKDFFYKEKLLIKNFISKGIDITYLKKYKLHAKSILIDNKYLFIGSINFSLYSLDKNREIGIITQNQKIIKKFLNIFNKN